MNRNELQALKEALIEAYGTANGLTKIYVELLENSKL